MDHGGLRAAHQGALREWGFGAMVRYDPLGSRLSLGRTTSLSLEAERRERTAGAVHAVFVRGTLQF